MTIRETSFFRDLLPFRLLRDTLIPEILERRKAERRLRLWSAASATGQEAYSLAILLREFFPQLEGWDVQIVGTDISQVACEYARRGRYSRMEVNRGLPARFLLKYFDRQGDEWHVGEDVSRMVRFERGNVCEPPVGLPSEGTRFDAVLLRNVLLCFAEEDRGRVLQEMHARMRRDAVLLLGNAEQAEDFSDRFRVAFEGECYFYRPIEVR
jgi:chemotaxis protein methyltransferase CheR